MEHSVTMLTEKDKSILYSYQTVAEGLAEFWGECCETVIHNLEHLDRSVMLIINGHLSGRQVGAPISEVTLSFLNRMLVDEELRHVSYFAKNKRGEGFKATISAIQGEGGKIIGLFCMNLYLNAPISTLVKSLSPDTSNNNTHISEMFVDNAEELMCNALEEAKKTVYNDPSISSSNKNKEIVGLLFHKGIFNLKDSVILIAEHLGISKNTVYMHIRNLPK